MRLEATIQTRWLDVDGLRVRCLVAGPSGPPVVLLHGSGVDAAGFSFGPGIPSLAEGFQVYAPDWPGFGESDPLPKGWTVAELVPYLGRLLDALQLERVSLVGLSLGGGVALGFALRHPERVDRLVLVDSYGLGGSLTESFGRLGALGSRLLVRLPFLNAASWALLRLLARNRGLARWILRAAVPHRPEAASGPLLDEFIRLLLRPGDGEAWRQLQAGEIVGNEMRTNYLPALPSLAVPTLIVHGEHDSAVPLPWAERAQRLIPDARLVVLPNSGHVSPLEQPEAFAAAVNAFLGENHGGDYSLPAPDGSREGFADGAHRDRSHVPDSTEKG